MKRSQTLYYTKKADEMNTKSVRRDGRGGQGSKGSENNFARFAV